jgi:hypothetical protein
MIFLIQYSRRQGTIVKLTPFDEREREKAANSRLEIEVDLLRAGIDNEVVLLEAESEEALRRTHRRYFEDAKQIATDSVSISFVEKARVDKRNDT